jgi:hypothetical protein
MAALRVSQDTNANEQRNNEIDWDDLNACSLEIQHMPPPPLSLSWVALPPCEKDDPVDTSGLMAAITFVD